MKGSENEVRVLKNTGGLKEIGGKIYFHIRLKKIVEEKNVSVLFAFFCLSGFTPFSLTGISSLYTANRESAVLCRNELIFCSPRNPHKTPAPSPCCSTKEILTRLNSQDLVRDRAEIRTQIFPRQMGSSASCTKLPQEIRNDACEST